MLLLPDRSCQPADQSLGQSSQLVDQNLVRSFPLAGLNPDRLHQPVDQIPDQPNQPSHQGLVLPVQPVAVVLPLMHRLVHQTVVQPLKHQHLVVAAVLRPSQQDQPNEPVVSDLREQLDHVLERQVLPDQVLWQHQVLGHAYLSLHQHRPFQLAVVHQL